MNDVDSNDWWWSALWKTFVSSASGLSVNSVAVNHAGESLKIKSFDGEGVLSFFLLKRSMKFCLCLSISLYFIDGPCAFVVLLRLSLCWYLYLSLFLMDQDLVPWWFCRGPGDSWHLQSLLWQATMVEGRITWCDHHEANKDEIYQKF